MTVFTKKLSWELQGVSSLGVDRVNQVDLATLIPDIRESVDEEGMQEASALVAELARAKVLVRGQPAVVLSEAANRRIDRRYPECSMPDSPSLTALEGAPRKAGVRLRS